MIIYYRISLCCVLLILLLCISYKNNNSFYYYAIKHLTKGDLLFFREIKYQPPYVDKYLKLPNVIEYNVVRTLKKNRVNIKYIIAVLSSPHNFKKRYSFRYRFQKYNTLRNSMVIFFIGLSVYENKYLLNLESSLYDDIVQFSFQNSYLNLTLLSIMALKYCYRYFKNIHFYIKTDDDMLINYRLLKILLKKLLYTVNAVYGHMNKRFRVIRNYKNKNYIPFSVYPYEYMPCYVYGGLIIITKLALNRIYNQTHFFLNYIWREDINLGLLCSMSHNKIYQFPNNIDITINSKDCNVSENILAIEIKNNDDCFYCI